MIPWLIAAALLEAAAVSSDSAGSKSSASSRLLGRSSAILTADGAASDGTSSRAVIGSSDGASSAILTADGQEFLSSSAEREATIPQCSDPCDSYYQGVDKETVAVCIDASRACAPQSTCGSSWCGQRPLNECPFLCSEWFGEPSANDKTFNICQVDDGDDTYKCSGDQQCGKGTYPCAQKEIKECEFECAGYAFLGNLTVTQNTDLLCMNLDPESEDFNICLPLPCSVTHHNSAKWVKSQVCRQALPHCGNKCAKGSDEPNATTTCFDAFSEKCENHLECPVHLTRCRPNLFHQDLTNIDKETDSVWLEESAKEVGKMMRKDA